MHRPGNERNLGTQGRRILKIHLTSGSAAIDTGIDSRVTTDIDGDARALGGGQDIGADGFFADQLRVFLPLTVRNH